MNEEPIKKTNYMSTIYTLRKVCKHDFDNQVISTL